MRIEIRRCNQKVRTTTVYVNPRTRQRDITDRVVVITMARIEQIGTPMNCTTSRRRASSPVSNNIGSPAMNFSRAGWRMF